jgi:sporulation protein YlmC with PRC-barrel domain
MEFREGVGVFTPDGRHLGNVDMVVIDPRTRRVTHVVIRQGHFLPEDKVIAVEQLSTATEDRIVLNSEPDKLPPFEEMHYIPLDEESRRTMEINHSTPLLWGDWFDGGVLMPIERSTERVERNIPQGEVAIPEGTEVQDLHGERVGRVDEVITNPKSGDITHLVIQAGHLWGKQRKAIPINWVATFGEEQVKLAVGLKTLEKLPEHQPK